MGLEHRPYIGSFRLSHQKVVQHTPDALVYLNGSLSLPGCHKCNGQVDFQRFVSEVSTDAGTESSSLSASFTLSIPVHFQESFGRDANFIIKPGLEVHIYYRGYFPVKGLYQQDSDRVNAVSSSGSPLNLTDVLAYPYYPAFRGVVTQVSTSYSGGVQTASIQCASLLHFWQYAPVSTNASVFGERPENSGLRTSYVGHNFTGMHPYEIVYKLYRDTAGAAGGVRSVLDNKTNVGARNEFGNTSYYQLQLEYWKKRFNADDIPLRMHGVSGELFNDLQATYLGTTNSTNLMSGFSGRFGENKDSNPAILANSPTKFLYNRPVYDALTFLAQAGERPGFDLNMLEIEAYHLDIGQYGVNLWESTYESKMDIIQRVCELTGFEFFQDVDGAFVFKPPMYNLDTSPSRIYRLEDIDIINITFNEQEPQVTYMSCKGSHFQNISGLGMENEWGIQGQYIDYRLVAQYGWRPGDMEVAYLNDSSSMFFAAVNRMDILNAPIKSAQVSIPIRPEIRPGYPFYIPYLDCYYYCNSFSHSFSFGGQCTTNLQLIAKRAKFFAPGDVTKSGIESIDLSKMNLPPKPLIVLDNSDRPRLSGFPNVVMALDPTALNPLFFLVGSDLENLTNSRTLENLVKACVDMQTLQDKGNGTYELRIGSNTRGTFFFSPDGTSTLPGVATALSPLIGRHLDPEATAPSGTVDLQSAAAAYTQRMAETSQTIQTLQGDLSKLNTQLQGLYFQLRQSQFAQNPDQGLIVKIQVQIDDLRKKVGDAESQIATVKASAFSTSTEDDANGIALLRRLLNTTSEKFAKDYNKVSGLDGYADTVTLLELLSDKKAIFTNGQLPGAYRYYSVSHPDPKNQGQFKCCFNPDSGLQIPDPLTTDTDMGISTNGYLPNPQTSTSRFSIDAQFGEIPIKAGIRVVTNEGSKGGAQVLPTKDIQTLMFAIHDSAAKKKVASPQATLNFGMISHALLAGLQDIYDSDLEGQAQQNNAVGVAIQTPDGRVAFALEDTGIEFPSSLVFPLTVPIMGVDVFGVNPKDYKFLDNPGAKGLLYPGAYSDPLKVFWDKVSKSASMEMFYALKAFFDAYATSVNKDAGKLSILYQKFSANLNIDCSPGTGIVSEDKGTMSSPIYSPVFPVSDERGYEVVGSYRYGRGLDISPDGGLKSILDIDIFSYFTKTELETVLKSLQNKEIPDDISQQVLSRLRTEFTDSEIRTITNFEGEIIQGNQLATMMATAIATKGNDPLHKITTVNAGYSLADLRPPSLNHVCDCKVAEALNIIDIFSTQDFINVASSLPDDFDPAETDSASMWQIISGGQHTTEWQIQREAIQGSIPPGSSGVSEAIGNLTEQFDQAKAQLKQETDSIVAQAESIEDIF